MNPSTTTLGRAAAICAPLLSLLFASGAHAQDAPAGPPPAAPEPPPAAPATVAAARPGRAPAAVRLSRMDHARHPRRLALVQREHARHALAVLPEDRHRRVGLRLARHRLRDDHARQSHRSRTASSWSRRDGRSCASPPTYSSGTFYVQAQVELVGNKDQGIAQPERRRHWTISGSGSASGERGTCRWGASRRSRSITSAWRWT